MSLYLTKEELAERLETIAQFYCCYRARSGQMCDCKYLNPGEKMERTREASGCPEIKLARAVIMALSQRDFDKAVRRLERKEDPLQDVADLVEEAGT